MNRIKMILLILVLSMSSCALIDNFTASSFFSDVTIAIKDQWAEKAKSEDVLDKTEFLALGLLPIEGYKYLSQLPDTTVYYVVEFDEDSLLDGTIGTYIGDVVVAYYSEVSLTGTVSEFYACSITVSSIKNDDRVEDLRYFYDARSNGLILDGYGYYEKNSADNSTDRVQAVNLAGYWCKLVNPSQGE